MPCRNSLRSPGVGFTLVELLVVLAIVGILAAAGAYYGMDRTGPSVKGALLAISSSLNEARGMARGSGVTVPLTPSGTGTTQVLTYQIPGGAPSQYLHATTGSSARYCLVDSVGTGEPTSSALQALKDALKSTTVGGSEVFGATSKVWTTNLFDASSGVAFLPNGTVSTEAYVAVVAAQEGTAIPNGPVGFILVTNSGNLFRYYRSNSSSTWVRL